MATVVFMHVGPDVGPPEILVRSVRRHNPEMRIIQVTDQQSVEVAGVDEVVRTPRRHNNPMLFRMECFAALPVLDETWFLDTDMIVRRPLEFIGEPTPVAVCRRDFGRDDLINPNFRGMDFREMTGQTFGQRYPYLGCATRLETQQFWIDALADMLALPPKFHNWYGDQDAIRNVVDSGRYPVGFLPERDYACLPEYEHPQAPPLISHYKGQRKPLMLKQAAADGLI